MKKNTKQKIVNILKFSPGPLRLNDFSRILNIKAESDLYAQLKNSINELVSDGEIVQLPKRRYALNLFSSEEDFGTTYKGRIEISGDSGIVSDLKHDIKITIKHRNLNTALPGDMVSVRILANKTGKKLQGEVINILERSAKRIVGTLEFDGYFFFLVPDDERYYVDFLVPKSQLKEAKSGDKVSASFLKWVHPTKSPEATVETIIGSSGVSIVEYDSITEEYGLNESFEDDVNIEAEEINSASLKDDISKRIDLRKEEIITIDPDDAKDFDDALSLTIDKNGNYHLGVHIADVSHFVRQGSKIDTEALKRGNSTYLVDRVVPMLPEILSNDLCSLKPNRIRMAYSVLMELSPNLMLKSYKIEESVIRSVKRFTYDEALKIIEGGEGKHSELIISLHNLAELLKQKRMRQGGINFETSEIRFKLDENKVPVKAVSKTTTAATSLVEECMLMANKTIAEHVKKISNKYKLKIPLPFLYRIHDTPNPDKLISVLDFIMLMGHRGDARSGSSKAINGLLAQFEDRPEKSIVHQMLVRAMPKAEYAPQNIGHYGLGFTDYAHFTSPIRRYPDLVVHRILKEYSKAKPDESRINMLTDYLNAVGERCTETERNSMDAERASSKLASCLLSSKHVGEVFDGTISGVTNFGLFVYLDSIFSEGLVPIRDLLDDYYIFDEKNFRLVGRRKKKIYQFGGRIKVRITKVNLDKRKIDLKLFDS